MSLPLERLTILFAALCLGLLATKDVQAAAADRPNILFIFSDDHAYQALGCYGSKINQTPNLDRIAKEGMRFENCFVTNSICGPCRAVIQTGKYSHLNGFTRNGNRFNGAQQTFPKLLQAAGYQTAVVGKWHLESEPTGYDYWHILIGQGPYYNPTMLVLGGQVKHQGYTTDIITDEALDWLKNKRDAKKPFLLMYQHKAPHRDWQPGPKYKTKYDDVTIPEPETLFDDYANRASPAKNQAMTIARHLTPGDLKKAPPADLTGNDLVRWKYQTYIKDYLRCVDSVDENVGRVLEYLDETGLADNTVVIYSSDQGFYLGEHGWFDKRWMYEESLRTPLLVRWPGKIKPGTTADQMVLNLDFAETFLDLAGVKVPDDMQGRSIQPILLGESVPDWRKSVYYHYYEFPGAHSVAKHYGIRTERYKLINYYDVGEWELFDLQTDPHEMKSLYGDPKYAELTADLKKQLDGLREQFKDDGTVVGQQAPAPAPTPGKKKAPAK